ncbi:MAG: vanadium-dependent haloperoxidase [Bacteroidota bacterium]
MIQAVSWSVIEVAMKYVIPIALLISLATACTADVNPDYEQEINDAEFYHRSVKQLTDVIVHDIFSPPQAGRIYAYAGLAGYEAVATGDPNWQSLAGQITDLTEVPQPADDQVINHNIAAISAMLKTGKSLIFSGDRIEDFEESLMEELEAIQAPAGLIEDSWSYGEQVADHIIEWTKADNYAQSRSFPKFTITGEPGRWEPTPPDYMPGIEPSWSTIRTLTLDSAAQFKPLPPTAFSTDQSSQWWEEVLEVYGALQVEDEAELAERQAIAEFWDCNPYAMQHRGHLMFATKKISPGGHWINITGIAARKAEADFGSTAAAYALVGIALHDAFISCWDEKYRSALVRPETFINEHIDPEWMPLLQTPPFPEHTSGHSVVSRASAIILTDFFGENFAFDDDSEVEFGLPIRSYPSFLIASEEAAVSRLYGGIHYRPAIDYGLTQGESVGLHVLEQLDMRGQYSEIK